MRGALVLDALERLDPHDNAETFLHEAAVKVHHHAPSEEHVRLVVRLEAFVSAFVGRDVKATDVKDRAERGERIRQHLTRACDLARVRSDDARGKELWDTLDALVGTAPADGVYVARDCGYVEDDYRAGEHWRPCPFHGVQTAWDGPQ